MWAKRFQMEDKFNSIGRAATHRVGFTLFTLLLSSSIFFKQMDIKEIRWLAYLERVLNWLYRQTESSNFTLFENYFKRYQRNMVIQQRGIEVTLMLLGHRCCKMRHFGSVLNNVNFVVSK